MWQKLENNDFKKFNIEHISTSQGEVKFYAPYETIRELKKIINSSRLSDEEKLNFMSGLSTAGRARNNLEGLKHSFQVLATILTERALIGNSNRFVLPKYSVKFLNSSDIPSLDDGVKFEEKRYQLYNISLKSNEYIVCYDKKNFLGDFKGYVFTNYRIISTGMKDSFSLEWRELKSIKKKTLLIGCTLNGIYDAKLTTTMIEVAEAMLEYDLIANVIIERITGIVNQFSRLSFDRYTIEEYKEILNTIEEVQKEKNSKFYLYIKKTDTSISVVDNLKISLSDIKENIQDTAVIAQIEPHPKKRGAYIIRNLSDETWKYKVSEDIYTIEPQQARALIPDGVIEISGIKVNIKERK